MNTKTARKDLSGTSLAIAPSRELVSNFPTGEEISQLVALTRAEALASAAEFDVTTAKGRASIISVAVTVRDKKVKLDKAADKSKVEHQAIIKQINAGVRTVKDEFQAVQDEIRKPVTDWENVETARVDGLKARLAEISTNNLTAGDDSAVIYDRIVCISDIEVGEDWQEYQGEAAIVKSGAISQLNGFAELAIHREAMERELEERRAADAERDRLDAYEAMQEQAEADNKAFDQVVADAEIARAKAAEQARRDVEQAAANATKAAEDKAEADRVEAERKHKQELADAELARVAENLKVQKDQEQRDANKKRRTDAQKDILKALTGKTRPQVAEMLMNNEVPHVTLIL